MGGRHLHLGEDLVRIDSDQDPLSSKAQAFLLSAVLGEEMKPLTKWTLPCEELHCPQRTHPASLVAFAKTQKRGKWLESKALKRACPGQTDIIWGLLFIRMDSGKALCVGSPAPFTESLWEF